MSEFINTIDELGDDVVIDSIITRTITEFKDNRIVKVRAGAFSDCTALTAVDLPNVTTIGASAFKNCAVLKDFPMDNVVKIHDSAFYGCTSLTELNLPKFTGAVDSGDNRNIFQNCTSLKKVYMPEVLNVGTYGFFQGCTSLEELWTPKATSINQYHLYKCSSLRFWDAGFSPSLSGYNCIKECTSLETLILRSTSMVTTSTSTGSTLDVSYTGDVVCNVYVPQALIETYKAGTNWAAIYEAGRCNFIAIEGSQYE